MVLPKTRTGSDGGAEGGLLGKRDFQRVGNRPQILNQLDRMW